MGPHVRLATTRLHLTRPSGFASTDAWWWFQTAQEEADSPQTLGHWSPLTLAWL